MPGPEIFGAQGEDYNMGPLRKILKTIDTCSVKMMMVN
jgi:hypothetical protein